jgi:hypothetical protein
LRPPTELALFQKKYEDGVRRRATTPAKAERAEKIARAIQRQPGSLFHPWVGRKRGALIAREAVQSFTPWRYVEYLYAAEDHAQDA